MSLSDYTTICNLVCLFEEQMKKSSVRKSEPDWNDLAEAMKSMAHPERLAILHLISNCGCDQMKVKDIYEALHLEQSITSRHLGIMKKGGLLKREIKSGKIFYGFNNLNTTAQCIKKLLTE